ncbi:Stp1p NDAI_0H01110 [Naumovozyma dairenensis CBS 421]|uniref:Transcription factor STP1 n=1 Tax=Naumovozyma dairenensis (strain ATCC 10597 / BCRC 20456 / CBS 421 / NBRC 0211 / NRRL Y-12639) TaxID=1071378 RepID=G0WES4_NAUDC|nr:hypothetical protein NDAI_0H01110 [Naumovozyma dairenensis CBS 421]CCD26285.1 hypothetical protein NDAI_0H01110 [Naumovozyma dairenensis CBS 421]
MNYHHGDVEDIEDTFEYDHHHTYTSTSKNSYHLDDDQNCLSKSSFINPYSMHHDRKNNALTTHNILKDNTINNSTSAVTSINNMTRNTTNNKRGSQIHQYVCHHCNAQFRIKGYLTRHLKKHATEKAYTCPFFNTDSPPELRCHNSGGFSRRDTYKTHLKSRHILFPKGVRPQDRNKSVGHCAQCGDFFDSCENWVETHIESGKCKALPSNYRNGKIQDNATTTNNNSITAANTAASDTNTDTSKQNAVTVAKDHSSLQIKRFRKDNDRVFKKATSHSSGIAVGQYVTDHLNNDLMEIPNGDKSLTTKQEPEDSEQESESESSYEQNARSLMQSYQLSAFFPSFSKDTTTTTTTTTKVAAPAITPTIRATGEETNVVYPLDEEQMPEPEEEPEREGIRPMEKNLALQSSTIDKIILDGYSMDSPKKIKMINDRNLKNLKKYRTFYSDFVSSLGN